MPGVINTSPPPAIGSLLQTARPATKPHFRDGSLDHIPDQLLTVGFTGKHTLCRGYWRILAEIESVSGEGRKTGPRKKLNLSAVVAEVSGGSMGSSGAGMALPRYPRLSLSPT